MKDLPMDAKGSRDRTRPMEILHRLQAMIVDLPCDIVSGRKPEDIHVRRRRARSGKSQSQNSKMTLRETPLMMTFPPSLTVLLSLRMIVSKVIRLRLDANVPRNCPLPARDDQGMSVMKNPWRETMTIYWKSYETSAPRYLSDSVNSDQQNV